MTNEIYNTKCEIIRAVAVRKQLINDCDKHITRLNSHLQEQQVYRKKMQGQLKRLQAKLFDLSQ